MYRLRDFRGRFVKNLVEQPNSPSSSSEISYETKSSNNHSEPQNMENVGDPPLHSLQHGQFHSSMCESYTHWWDFMALVTDVVKGVTPLVIMDHYVSTQWSLTLGVTTIN